MKEETTPRVSELYPQPCSCKSQHSVPSPTVQRVVGMHGESHPRNFRLFPLGIAWEFNLGTVIENDSCGTHPSP